MAKPQTQTTETKTETTKGLPVKTAYLHSACIIGTVTEALLTPTKVAGIKMELAPTGLWVTAPKGKVTETHFIPSANIKNCVME